VRLRMLVRAVEDLVRELHPITTSEVSHGPAPPAAQSCVPHRAPRSARPPPRLHVVALCVKKVKILSSNASSEAKKPKC
jgi:hypothetical protein